MRQRAYKELAGEEMEPVALRRLYSRRARICLLEAGHSHPPRRTHSVLIMLGDLDGDHRWTAGDLKTLDLFLKDPFASSDTVALQIDMNQNGLL